MLASVPILEVSTDLFDQASGDTYARWTEAMLLDYLNSGERHLVYFKPTAYVITAIYQLIAGPKQSLPDGTASYQDPSSNTLKKAIELVKGVRNMGADGATAGASVYMTTPADMDEVYPGWRSDTANATVQNIIFDTKDRTVFETYPAQPSASMGWVELAYSAVPTELTSTGDSINLSDEYAEPLKNYMKYRAFALDAAISRDAFSKAIGYWNQFLSQIGRKDLIEKQYKGLPHGSSDKQLSQ